MLMIGAIFAAYFAGLFAYLATVAGTCTQGDAGQLGLIIVVLPAFGISLACVALMKNARAALWTTLFMSPVLIWQATFAIAFAVRTALFGASACDVLHNLPFPLDGREVTFIALWLLIGLGVPSVLFVLLQRKF